MSNPFVLGGLAALLTLSVALSQDAATSGVKPGDHVSYTYRSSPINARGHKSISDFQGKPVLLEFWGMNCPPCIESAVPSAVRMAREYGDEIGIIFCESQGHSSAEMERFAFDRSWMGTTAMWTTERAADSGAPGIPNYILLDSNGVVLSKGNPIEDHSKIKDLIDDELKSAKRVPKDAPKGLDKAWKEFLGGKWAKAIELAHTVAKSGGEAGVAAEELAFSFEARVAANVTRVERMFEEGHFAEGVAQLTDVERKAAGVASVAERLTALRSSLATDDVKREIAAEAALNNLLSKCYKDGIDDKAAQRLAKLAEAHSGTKAAVRATHLSRL